MKLTTIALVPSAFAAILLCASATRAPAPQEPGQTVEAEREAPRFVRVTPGAKMLVTNGEGAVLGAIADHVVDARSGRVRDIVIETKGAAKRLVAVPYAQFAWKKDASAPALSMSPELLASLPEFDRKKLEIDALEAAAAGMREPPREVLASRLQGRAVAGREQPLGKISELLLEPGRGTISLVLVSPGADAPREGTGLVVPWQALARDETGALELVAGANGQPSEAPKVTALAELEDVDFLKTVYAFYGLELPPAVLD